MFDERWGRRVGLRAFRAVLLATGLLCLGSTVPGRAVEIAEIPKPQRWVTDLTRSIPAAAIAEVEQIADRIERETGGQLVVVVLGTLAGKESRPLATELFNAWGIGRAEQDDGLLIFLALEDHRVELLLGSGIDDPARQRASDVIVQQVMVPRFQAGNPGDALVRGVAECARSIYGLGDPVASAPRSEAALPPAVAVPRPVAAPPPVNPTSRPAPDETSSLWGFGVLAGLAAVSVLFVVWVLRAAMVRRPRVCPSCELAMVLLDETLDDAHLESGEVTEEKLQSVDYRVWACPGCDQVTKLRHGTFFTNHRRCAGCNFVTASQITTVVQQATTSQCGVVQVDERCANCSYTESSTHTTPQLVNRTATTRRRYTATSASRSSSPAPRSFGGGRAAGGGPRSSGGGSTGGGGSSGRW